MKPSEVISLKELIQSLRKDGVTEFSYNGLTVKFGAGEAVQIMGKPIEFAPPPNQAELAESKKIADDTEYANNAEDALAQLQIDDPDAFEDALIQRELGQSERED